VSLGNFEVGFEKLTIILSTFSVVFQVISFSIEAKSEIFKLSNSINFSSVRYFVSIGFLVSSFLSVSDKVPVDDVQVEVVPVDELSVVLQVLAVVPVFVEEVQ
jgi:hypothetical protein